MAEIGASSSAPPNHSDAKPVVVRVKRKAAQSPLDAFWLEINERPLKRALLDFEKLSLSKSSTKEELKRTKVFVQHVETVSSVEATVDVVQSFVEPDLAEVSGSKTKSVDRRHNFKKETENIQDQILSKTRKKQEAAAKNARFEQIWRSRTGNKETVHGKLQDICQFYDVVRVDVEEKENEMKHMDETLEDHRILCNYLPLLREFIPSAAEEIESDLLAHKVGKDDYVYDFYTVKEEVDEIAINASSHPFPLVQVDEEDFCDGPDDSDYGSDDSNAENNPLNEYPDEDESEDDEESTDSNNESEEESDDNRSLASEDVEQECRSESEDFLCREDDDDDEYDEDNGSVYGYNDEDGNYCEK